MRLCYLADGQSIHTQKWCTHFTDLGYEVHLITFRDCAINKVKVHFVNTGEINSSGGNWRVLLYFFKIKKILRKINPDILHAQFATSYGITGSLVNFHPYIISAWGSDLLISPKKSVVLRLLLKFAFSRANVVTVVAKHMVKSLIDLGVKPSKINLITHGINTSIFYKQNIPKHQNFTLICTRNLEPLYNHVQLIDAFELAIKSNPNLKLKLLGDGSIRNDLELYVKSKNLDDHVFFLGRVSQIQMAKELNMAHVFVSVSTTDGDVVSLVEAIACGNYCIVSDIPANHNWIKSGINGFFVPLYDSEELSQTINKTFEQYNQLISKGSELNNSITRTEGNWEKNMEKAEILYQKVMKNKFH